MKTLTLNGTWNIASDDGRFQFDGQVPTSFFKELEASGYWGEHDVFYRENNRQCAELANRAFTFSRAFAVAPDMLPAAHAPLYLECDGLDTIADLYLNGQKFASVDNMHRRYRFDVSQLVKVGENRIEIRFANIIQVIAEKDKTRKLWQVGTPLIGANHIRKMFCSFGWDWGPQIPDTGIYRDIRLVRYEKARIADLHVTQTHANGAVTLSLTSKVESWVAGQRQLEVTLIDPKGQKTRHTFPAGEQGEIRVDAPQLWWPNGYGEQALYTLETTLVEDGKVLHSHSQRIGLRTLTLERKPDEWGESFQFNCNGVAIFAKGANYIPEDVYLNRVTPAATRKLLQTCVDAHFNCLRVWGGGIYPNDSFFDICDELGIMIWQDLMFSCSIYDIHNPRFFESITHEVRDALHRMRHHASLALICGNNEMEWAFEQWDFPKTKENRVEYIKQYEVLFPALVAEVCPEIDYWPASPSSGGHFDNPNDYTRGDVHDWNVWHGRKNYTEFRKNCYRFLSEFGFQSFPNIKTIRSYTAPEDRNIFSPVMEDHQRNESDNGNSKIFHFIADYYRYPKDFESIVYTSQCSQSEALRYAVEHLRQNRGRCMGTTYWQLNDNWPTASWSSVDYFGRWKAMHYGAKRCYDPILVSIKETREAAEIHLTNDRLQASQGTLKWKLLTLKGEVLRSGERMVECGALSSTLLEKLDFSQDVAGHLARDRYLSVSYLDQRDQSVRFTTATFVPYKQLNLEAPDLKTSIREGQGVWEIHVEAGLCFAKFVELDLVRDDVVFSDNYFDLDAGQVRVITVPQSAITQGELLEQLRTRSLFDSYA